MWFKYIIKNVARRHGKTVTFMPKPLYGDNGSGMHVHQSIWKGGKPLFAGDGYAGLSELAMCYIGGILKHAPALAALLQPDHQQLQAAGAGLRGAGQPGLLGPQPLGVDPHPDVLAVSPKAKRIEFRSPDPSANGYLAFAAMLMAGLDGIENKINPGQPLDKDIYGMSPEELKDIPKMPGSLDEALERLRKDHEFLLKGDVFTEDVIETWIQYKYDKEVNPIRMRPTPARVRALLRHLGIRAQHRITAAALRGGRPRFGLQSARRALRPSRPSAPPLRELLGGLPRSYWALWVGLLVNRIGSFVVPFLSLYLTRERGLSVAEAGGLVSLWGLGAVGAGPVVGRGRRPPGAQGRAASSRSSGGAALTMALGFVSLARRCSAPLVFGVGFIGEIYRPASHAVIADVVPPEDRVRAFGLLYWAVNLGVAIGLALAGLMASVSYMLPLRRRRAHLAGLRLGGVALRAGDAAGVASGDGPGGAARARGPAARPGLPALPRSSTSWSPPSSSSSSSRCRSTWPSTGSPRPASGSSWR